MGKAVCGNFGMAAKHVERDCILSVKSIGSICAAWAELIEQISCKAHLGAYLDY
jgi:hypothetical protein